jgi:hypothetical protein
MAAPGLALAIVGGGGGVPAFLARKRLLALDLGLLIAGAKERGELELRVTRLLAEAREARDVILMCARPRRPRVRARVRPRWQAGSVSCVCCLCRRAGAQACPR